MAEDSTEGPIGISSDQEDEWFKREEEKALLPPRSAHSAPKPKFHEEAGILSKTPGKHMLG
ncbi:MAG: hypothetical protein V4681_03530 [Patescibacteria group bacterium]